MTIRIKTFACLLCLACTYSSFAQTCPDNISTNNGQGNITLFFTNSTMPSDLSSIDLDLVDFVSNGISVTSFPGNRYQTVGQISDITLTGDVTLNYSTDPPSTLTCNYINGDLNSDLPVDLTDWTGHLQSEDIELRWSTAWEEHNAGFEIERSFDGQGFELIGTVGGNGNSELDNHYTYTDQDIRSKALGNTAYYRLIQIDYDGSKTYTEVIAIDLELDYSDFEVTKVIRAGIGERRISVYYYNPPNVRKVNLLVSNLQGNILMQSSLSPTPGINIVDIELGANLDSFIVLSMDNGRKVIQEKILWMDTY